MLISTIMLNIFLEWPKQDSSKRNKIYTHKKNFELIKAHYNMLLCATSNKSLQPLLFSILNRSNEDCWDPSYKGQTGKVPNLFLMQMVHSSLTSIFLINFMTLYRIFLQSMLSTIFYNKYKKQYLLCDTKEGLHSTVMSIYK